MMQSARPACCAAHPGRSAASGATPRAAAARRLRGGQAEKNSDTAASHKTVSLPHTRAAQEAVWQQGGSPT